jgi:hypothetical protein
VMYDDSYKQEYAQIPDKLKIIENQLKDFE